MRRLLAALLISALLVGVAGCVPEVVDGAADASVTVVMEGTPDDLNPYSPSLAARRVGRLVFAGLTRLDASGTPVPDLAEEMPTRENGGISSDGLTVTYHLRPGVTWSDGEPVTAADVAFTWSLLAAGELHDQPGVDTSAVVSVTATDARTLTVKLTAPASPVVWRMVPYVLPEHVLGDAGPGDRARFWLAPVGCGSYQVARFAPGVSVTLEPTGPGPRLSVYFASSVASARELYDGSAAAVWLDAPPLGPASDAEREDAVLTNDWYRYEFNRREGTVVSERAVREAFSLLVVAPDWMPAGTVTDPYGIERILRSEPDTRAAARVLDAAGWRMDASGIRRKAGRDLEVSLVTPPLSTAEGRRVEQLQAAARSIGMDLSFRVEGYELYGNATEGNPLLLEEWDVAWLLLPVEAPTGFAWPYSTDDVPSMEDWWGLNATGISDDTLEEYGRRLSNAESPQDAAAIGRELGAYLQSDAVVVWDAPLRTLTLSKGVAGANPGAAPVEALADVSSWAIIEGTPPEGRFDQ